MFSSGDKKAQRRRRDMKGRPKLDRRNAAKNIDYEASWAASTSEEPPSLRLSRSLDLSPAAYSKTTSFRIAGSVEDEVDLLCRSLGLSGPDDFAIPIAVWEESLKARSSSDLLPRSRFFDSENPLSGSDLSVQEAVPSEVVVSVRSSEHRSGIRPTVITPPPLPDSFIALPVEDRSSSTGDMVRCFGLKDEKEIVDGARSLGSEVMEEDSFSASDDEDLPSTTDEFVISPSGRFKKVIRSWMRGQLLGSGSFGTVYEGISDDGTFIAVKEVSLIDKSSNAQQCILQLEQEIVLLSQFEHENIVQYYGTDKEESKLFIFLELVTQGSLASLYQKYHLRDTQVSIYTRQILNGLNYLHERNVVHRDIKCANILVHANGSVKLADFGLAKKISKFNDLKSCKGSVYWMAPEVVNPKKAYGRAPDIWSLGCTVLEMLTRQIPYPNVEWQHAFFKIGRGVQPPIPNHLSSDAQDFIRQCVQVDPNSRPTASQLLEHPFIRRSVII